MRSDFEKLSQEWLIAGFRDKYAYDRTWLGVPFIQLPEDVMRMQQIVCATRPEVIIETGTKMGGSATFFASMLAMTGQDNISVLTIDKVQRWRKGDVFDDHALSPIIKTVVADSVSDAALEAARRVSKGRRTMVFLDSSHHADHVAKELELYSELVSVGCHLIVADGITEDLPEFKQNAAKPAREFVNKNPQFFERDVKHGFVTYFKNGYLERFR